MICCWINDANQQLFFNRDFTYYKMNNLDNRISNPDQLLTTDVERFCSSITELYSNISKPILDIVIYVHRLAVTIGGQVKSVFLFKVNLIYWLLNLGSKHYGSLFVRFWSLANPLAPPSESYDGIRATTGGRVPLR